jgi:hypothetical protein
MKELWNNIFHRVYYHPLDNYYHHHDHHYMYAYIQKSIYTAHPEFRPLQCCKSVDLSTLSHKLLLNKNTSLQFCRVSFHDCTQINLYSAYATTELRKVGGVSLQYALPTKRFVR